MGFVLCFCHFYGKRGEQTMRKEQNKRKWLLRLAVLALFAVFLILPFTAVMQARAFDFELDDDNNLIIESKYKEAASTATIRYKSGDWYFFPADEFSDGTGGGPGNQVLTKDFYNNFGFKAASELVYKGPVDANGMYTTRRQISAADLFDWVIAHKGYDYVHDNGGTIKFYANRVLQVVKNGTVTGTYYDYDTISKVANWSSGALYSFETVYDCDVVLSLKSTPFTIEVVDEGGNTPEGYEKKEFAFPYSEVYYSETIKGLTVRGKSRGIPMPDMKW